MPGKDPNWQSQRPSETRASQNIPAESLRSLNLSAEQMGVVIDCLLLAGFAALLLRLTRQGSLAIVVEPAEIAHFRLEEDCSFRAVIAQAGNTTPRKSDGHETAFQYQFLASAQSPRDSQEFELEFTVRDGGGFLELGSPEGFWSEGTLRDWLGYLLNLIENGAHNPEFPVNQLAMWDEKEARQRYSLWNQTAVDFPGDAFVHHRFSNQAKRSPTATAVISAHARYTYRELDEKSDELAVRLIANGAGPGRSVAICMERSAHLPMALLAVLKSGACYVPLDPHNPSGRLRSILEECAPAALISDRGTADSLSKSLKIDSLPILLADQPAARAIATDAAPHAALTPGNLAYIIYTSGSTGIPKGVRITHRALLNLICSMWRRPGVNPSDRTLAVAPISFDIATMDMFLPICSGGTLVIADRKDAVDPYRLAQLIKDHDITCMQATPATWRMMIGSGWTGKRNLKMISGGEALPRELANDLLERGGELWNCYGPTETAIYSGVLQIHQGSGIVPVGPPMANTTFYVLDKAGQLVPPGVAGELYIGGLGVSPGYVNRPELNAKRFVPDCFTTELEQGEGESPRLLFATGDLVRIVNENQLEFFGRLDYQVKLRGFRIELGEIESVLRSNPSVNDAVVLLREDIPGEPRLVAYVIFAGVPVGAAALREFISKSLPEYMLPTLVVQMEHFPLSGSGKIDRRALPRPESVPWQIAADRPGAEPARDQLESTLLRIFRDLLKIDTIGVTDSFFRYGGYSLLTVQLFARIERELGVSLPISLLFDAPTVSDLARVIRSGVSPSVIVPIRPYGNSAPIFLIQSYLLYSAILEIVEPDRPVYGVREMGDEREPMSMEDRVRKFSQEILAVCPEGPLSLAGWCAAGSLTVEIARQLRESGHQVGLVALFDAECPGFTLPRGFGPRFSRLFQKVAFHVARIRRIPWPEKVTYIKEALIRNWDGLVEAFYGANLRTMIWLKRHFGISLSKTAFDTVYASMSGFGELSIRPYPGKLNLFRAADIPNFSELDETLGWSSIAQEGVKVNFVPGDHVSMFKRPHNFGLAKRLQQDLQEFDSLST
jgi:amino acid adenylation domain-containing protein